MKKTKAKRGRPKTKFRVPLVFQIDTSVAEVLPYINRSDLVNELLGSNSMIKKMIDQNKK